MKFSSLINPYITWRAYYFPISIKPWRTILPVLSFKGVTRTFLVKTSMYTKKYLTPYLKEETDQFHLNLLPKFYLYNKHRLFFLWMFSSIRSVILSLVLLLHLLLNFEYYQNMFHHVRNKLQLLLASLFYR